MTTAALQLDLDLLNELFDNQKMLDGDSLKTKSSIFDDNNPLESSIFDEDPFLSSSMSFADPSLGIGGQNAGGLGLADFQSNEDLALNFEDEFFEQKSRSMTAIVVPVVVEIAVISYGVMYFS